MQSFREYLTEAKTSGFAPWHPKTGLIATMGGKYSLSYTVTKKGTLSVNRNNRDEWPFQGLGNVPGGYGFLIKYGNVRGFPTLINDQVTNLWGFPETINGHTKIICNNLKTLDHLKTKVSEHIWLDCEDLVEWGDSFVECYIIHFIYAPISLKDIKKHLKVQNCINFDDNFFQRRKNKGVLGLCGFENRVLLSLNNDWTAPRQTPEGKALHIVMDNGDILDCQEELISKGLKDYAKL